MSIMDKILDKVVPYDCLGCGEEGRLLCDQCAMALTPIPVRCYRCHDPSPGWLTCPMCFKVSGLYKVRVKAVYKDNAKDLIWRLKSSGARAAASLMADLMSKDWRPSPGMLIIPAPTSSDRIRQRGYDQARLLTRQLAKRTKLPYADCLARQSKVHQVGAGRQQRQEQLKQAFRIKNPHLVMGQHVLLVDDVITTGATLESAARALVIAGAKRVEAVAFAQPLYRLDSLT